MRWILGTTHTRTRVLRHSDEKEVGEVKRQSFRTQPSLLCTMNYSSTWIDSVP